MSSLCIIPARGGSKRIHKKNVKDFLGKPIIAYSIEVAKKSGLFDEIMVSTDDHEIAEISMSYGANVPFMRSADNSNDLATTLDVLLEVQKQYFVELKKSFKYICCVYPTAPLINERHLTEGYDLLIKRDASSVLPVVAFSYPIWRGFKICGEKLEMVNPEYLNSRSQDLTMVYHDAGQWYWYDPNKINDKTLFTNKTFPLVLNELEVQDIDNQSDWLLAELKYKMIHGI